MKKLLTNTIFGALLASSVAFASSAEEIAVVVKIDGIPWYNLHGQGVEQAGKDLGVDAFQVGPVDADPAQQVKIIEDLIARGVDAIAVVPNDANVLAPVLAKAQENGIVVVTNESIGQEGADWNVEVTIPDEFAIKIFEDMAQGMGGKGEYAVFVGTLTAPLHNYWADVGIAYINEKYPEMTLVTDRFGVAESVEDSRATTLDLMKTYPELAGIAAMGSLGPIGAGQALTELNETEQVFVSGTVIPNQGMRYLKTGAIDRGTLWSPIVNGYVMAATAKAIMDGEKIEDGFSVEDAGSATVNQEARNIQFNAILDITKDNVAEYGF